MRRKLFLAVVFLMLTVVSLSKVSGEEKGLVGYWKFDEGKGSIAKDSSKKRNNGKIYGAEWVEGVSGKALRFDGIDDYVDCGSDASLDPGTSDFTLEAWIKTSLTTKGQAIVGRFKYIGDYEGDSFYVMVRNGKIRIEMNDKYGGMGYQTGYIMSIAVADGLWHHIVAVFDRSDKMKIYVDGVKDESGLDISHKTESINPTYELRVGIIDRAGSMSPFNGIIDEVRIYNRALSAKEIENHYYKMGGIRYVKCSASEAEANHDVNVVKDRIVKPLLERKVDTGNVEQMLKTLEADGSWGRINYRDKTRAGWKTQRHISRNLTALVLAYKSPKSPLRNSPKLKQGVFASLDYWLKHDFQNPNWWHNVIGIPRSLGPILLILDSELTVAQRKKGIEILKRGKLGMTGQNLVWVADITINRGIMEGNPGLVNSAFRRIAGEIKITRHEGIQHDFSFHQHGKCLQNHGYGAGFAVDCSRLAGLAAKTRFAFSREKIDILTGYVLDGSQWMAYGSACDYGAIGREITRPGRTAKYLLKAAGNLLKLSTDREKELKALAARIADRATAPLEGNRHFWRSDIMTHQRKDYYASARMYSTRIDNTDNPCNSEGLKSHHIADGCNFLFVSGDEYQDIFPVWDWQKIPGTTVEQNGVFAGSPRRKGTKDFVGGVSDGQYGLAVFDLERDKLQARKAWFFFDREYVCLGAGITCRSQNQVITTVNQCYLRGDVTTFSTAEEKRLSKSEHRLKSPITVHHNNVAYMFNSDANVLLHNTPQEGSWYAISRSRPKDKISRDVFTLCIDHGTIPQNAAYSYIVCPGMDRQQAKAYAKEPEVEVLSNTADIQAVKHRKLRRSQIAFFKSGSLRIDEKTTVRVNKPCLMMVHHVGHEFRLSISDPTQKLREINIEVSGTLQGEGCRFDPGKNASTVSLTLPTGGHAGQSIVRMFRKDD